MLRVHFTHEDLVRVRVVPTYGPLVEAMFGLRALRIGQLGAVPELWRRRVMRGERRWAAPLSEVMGPELAFDIFTLIGRTSTAAEGLESVVAMSRQRLGTEIEATVDWRNRRRLDARRWPSAWVKRWPTMSRRGASSPRLSTPATARSWRRTGATSVAIWPLRSPHVRRSSRQPASRRCSVRYTRRCAGTVRRSSCCRIRVLRPTCTCTAGASSWFPSSS